MGSIATNCWTDSGLWTLLSTNHLEGEHPEALKGVSSPNQRVIPPVAKAPDGTLNISTSNPNRF